MKDELLKIMKNLTKHEFVEITDRGNSAIFLAMQLAKIVNPKNIILIPDQGGWLSYKTYPKYFGFEVIEVKTNRGVIDLEDLKSKISDASAFIVSSFAGYFAEQDMQAISKVCREAKCLLIEDASGALGDEVLCNGLYSDVIIGSFGRWKVTELGYGGWISSNIAFHAKVKEGLSLIKVHDKAYEEIFAALEKNKLVSLLNLQKKVKEELSDLEIFHKDKRGVNVVVAYDEKVLDYCKEKGYEYVLCPKYIRVNEKAISIELKRLTFND
tara:strand:+ start:11768 stop:12574 length:807 start_codon:yes stop_codon:yes gene_type:complete